LVSEQSRVAFDQYDISTASGSYLSIRAKDNGIERPNKLGINDSDFRSLAIETINSKLTNDAFNGVLEAFYGPDSVRGYVESHDGPFEVYDKGSLNLLIDEHIQFSFVADVSDFANPTNVTPLLLAESINRAFVTASITANCVVDGAKVRIYSNSRGLKSSIAVTGGTLQPFLQFETPVYGRSAPGEILPIVWTVSNPEPGVVRFSPSAPYFYFAGPTLRIGDYVTIVGNFFPKDLLGSWEITNIDFRFVGFAPTEWFEIKHPYLVP